MMLIDADKFLSFLIFSKHIDSLKCKEVKEAVEMCKVDVLEQIRDEINNCTRFCFETDGKRYFEAEYILQIIDKYMKGEKGNE